MKNKIILTIILIMLTLPIVAKIYDVQAYSGELDPNLYISMPMIMTNINNKVTGRIRLSSSASGYTMYYQKIDLTETQYKTITSKESINEALTVIPNYTDSWTKINDEDNNVTLDFTKATTGDIYFVLWAKITNGTDTYYDLGVYSSKIEATQTDGSKDDSQGGTTSGTSNDNKDDGEKGVADFSKAKFELVKNNRDAQIEITGATPAEGYTYSLFITSNSNKPDINTLDLTKEIHLNYNEKEKKFSLSGTGYLIATENVELNQDLYVSVVERKGTPKNVVAYGIKLNRYEEPKYADAFSSATEITNKVTQIITNFTHSYKNNRKMQIKVGKITDTEILKKIKDEDSTGFSDLLSYAKSNSGIYDQTVDSANNYAIDYYDKTGLNIDKEKLEDNEYYYLYVKTDDENGKYISNEAVTFSQAHVYDNSWYLFFYGNSDFKWTNFETAGTKDTPVKSDPEETGKKDPDEATGKLPYTGVGYAIISAIGIIAVVGVVAKKKYNWFKDI